MKRYQVSIPTPIAEFIDSHSAKTGLPVSHLIIALLSEFKDSQELKAMGRQPKVIK